MAQQLIVTSAKQGLEGGTGDQAVLRSAGMPPQVASRLKAAGGYSHPFPHGDRRNPVVYVHRIEEAAGKTWHVLGCIRDVGSDHTGRSNFLAHMLAADQAEARGKKGGPAAVMAAAGLFVQSWQGPPDGAAQTKLLVAGDETPVKGSCPAWTAAGLDPGLAGDLAMNAAAGKQVVIVTRPGDDVLALFRDALKLVEPGKRWSVTFNTCAIESFNGIWKAIRDDLPQARGLRESPGAVVVDLTKNPRGSDDAYARFARGEADALPWQAGAKPSQTAAVEDPGAGPATLGPKRGPPPSESGPKGPPRFRRGLDGKDSPIFVPPPEERPRRWWVLPVGSVLAMIVLVGGLAAYVLRDDIKNALWPKPAPPVPEITQKEEPSGPTPAEMAREENRRREAIARAKRQLADAWGGRTVDKIRETADELVRNVTKLRKDTATEQGLKIMLDGGGDASKISERAIAAAERADAVARRPEDGDAFVADVEAAAKELASVVSLLDATVNRLPAIAEAERKARAEAMERQRVAEAGKAQQDAFAAFSKKDWQSLTVALPTPNAADVAGIGMPIASQKPQVELGPFAADDLLDPVLRLAVPEETISGVPFAAEIQQAADRWEIKVTKGFTGLDGTPQTIATLVSRDGMLVLDVDSRLLDKRPIAILRRCVILAEAKDPATKRPLVREIRLVKPVPIGPMPVVAMAGKQGIKIPTPGGIFSRDTPPGGTQTPLALPVSGIEVVGDWCGRKESIQLPKQASLGVVRWPDIQLAQLSDGVFLELVVDLSLPQATLAATPVLTGPKSAGSDLEKLAEFVEKWAEKLPDVKKKFDKRVTGCPGTDFETASGSKSKSDVERVKSWFLQPLATADKMGLALPRHETIESSMDLYFGLEYQRQDKALEIAWERKRAAEPDQKKRDGIKREKPDFPSNFNDWYARCGATKESEWPREFGSRLTDWSQWFWREFETNWERNVAMAKTLGQGGSIRLLEITSIARDPDDPGKVYRVPLVTFDESARVTPDESLTVQQQPAKAAAATEPAGSDGESTTAPARPTGL